MNLALVHSRARTGVRAPTVRVEVHLAGGLPAMSIVGLPEAAVREAKDRVRAAILCAQFEFPARRITINLAPADLPKEGGYRLLARHGRVQATCPYHGRMGAADGTTRERQVTALPSRAVDYIPPGS